MDNVQNLNNFQMNDNEKLERAIQLLKSVLLESTIDNEFDEEISNFLKEINELPEGYHFYNDEEV